MKTNKHQTLYLVKQKGGIFARDLFEQFNYSPSTARSYLAHLTRQDLLERTSNGHALSSKGNDRLHFFEVSGCGALDCPRCESKEGYYTCPTCGHRVSKEKAHMRPIWDTPFFKREAGVYCPLCQAQILSEPQFQMLQGK